MGNTRNSEGRVAKLDSNKGEMKSRIVVCPLWQSCELFGNRVI